LTERRGKNLYLNPKEVLIEGEKTEGPWKKYSIFAGVEKTFNPKTRASPETEALTAEE